MDDWVIVTPFEVVIPKAWGQKTMRATKRTISGRPDMRTKLGKLCARYKDRVFDLSSKRWHEGYLDG